MPESAKPRVAVIGLGSMGFGMATSLRRAGLEVTGCDVSADSVTRFVADGGKGASTPAEAAKSADIVVSVVVNAAQTETILFGANGVAETLGKGAVFISSATMDPDVARRLAKQLEGNRAALPRRADFRRRAARGAGRTHDPRIRQSGGLCQSPAGARCDGRKTLRARR